jgi:hypothetical protein
MPQSLTYRPEREVRLHRLLTNRYDAESQLAIDDFLDWLSDARWLITQCAGLDGELGELAGKLLNTPLSVFERLHFRRSVPHPAHGKYRWETSPCPSEPLRPEG